jgi:serine/threonine protein kinase
MADSVEDRIGQQLGNYRLLRLLRQDNTVDVYQGEHIFLKTQAAIKVLPGELSQKALEVFIAGTRDIAQMKHPNILRLLEFGVEGKTPFLVTDYTSNGSLRQRHARGIPIAHATIVSYVKQIASALQHIHDKGLVHGGVRPENMLPGPQNRILLSDFSPMVGTLDEASTSILSGSQEEEAEQLKYMAPEQLSGNPGPASDQYALGIVVYEWLSGDTPFHGSANEIRQQHYSPALPPLHTKAPTVSPELEQVVMTALKQDPAQRFASIAAFAHALEQILQPAQPVLHLENGQTNPQMRTEPLRTPAKMYTRRKVTGGISIGLILLVLLVIGGSLLYKTGIFAPSTPIRPVTSAQATQTVTTRGTQQASATFTAQSPAKIYALATSGNPFINDPLNNASKSTLEIRKGTLSSCTYANAIYHIMIVSRASYTTCLAQKSTVHNFAYEVQMRIVKGDTGGIIFRSDSTASNFYTFFMLRGDNAGALYELTLYKKGKPQDIQSTYITGNTHDLKFFTVIAYENTFYFYINQKFVMVAEDNTLAAGSVGMYALNGVNSGTDVEFRDAKVWKL